MSSKLLPVWVGIAGLSLLAGCAQMEPRANLMEQVIVKVAPVGSPPAGYTCIAKTATLLLCVSQDPIEPPGGSGALNTIPWKLDTPGWVFDPRKGIDIRPGGHWTITPGAPASGPTTFQAQATKNGKWYKYSIEVKQPSTGLELKWDPSIMN